MASILFLGYSNLVKGRILPILKAAGFSEVAIAKYEGQHWDEAYRKCGLPVVRYDSYDEGLKNFEGDLVYVSTVNSTHAEVAARALEAGFHTVVDKPATLRFEEAKELVALARAKNRFLGESVVYLMHPQLAAIRRVFNDNGDAPKLAAVHFSMPPFLPDNFRYRRSLGGGALPDTAPYAVSVGRYFFGSKPLSVDCVVTERDENGLDIAYSLLMKYAGGKAMIGYFGFNTEYINQIHLMGNRTNVLCNRIFTIPDDMENELTVNHLNEVTKVKCPKANNFERYLSDVLAALKSGDYEDAYRNLLWDAEAKEMIINNIR